MPYSHVIGVELRLNKEDGSHQDFGVRVPMLQYTPEAVRLMLDAAFLRLRNDAEHHLSRMVEQERPGPGEECRVDIEAEDLGIGDFGRTRWLRAYGRLIQVPGGIQVRKNR